MRASAVFALLALSAPACAAGLGTLFHSPQERAALDRLRRGDPAEQASVARPDPVVTGFVKRSDGKSTVFIDNRPYPARDPRIQGLIGPRIVERFEPNPLPPPAPAAPAKNGEAGGAAKPAPGKKGAAKPPGDKED